jgi:hypothetical protein
MRRDELVGNDIGDSGIPEPLIICVLGMHRSGTSVVTGLLSLLDMYLGPQENLIEAGPDNPKGFWEHRLIVELNDQILSALGGNWCMPPSFPPGWEQAPELDNLTQQARRLIQQDFAGAELWGWKDPRSCLTLPFWQRLLPRMQYLVCVRNPVDVARSLQRRDGFSLIEGIQLWLVYMRRCLEHTVGQRRAFMLYEDVMWNWSRPLQRLAAFVGQPERAEQRDVQDTARSFIVKDLQHHQTSAADSTDESQLGLPEDLLRIVQQVYAALRRSDLSRHDLDGTIQEALDLIDAERAEREPSPAYRWQEQARDVMEQIGAVIPPGETFILADPHKLRAGPLVAGRHCLPFLERDGYYGGRPTDDTIAVMELERLRRAGASFIAFAWPSFWWLDCYAGLNIYLHSRGRCVLQNDLLMIFDLRT